MSRQLTALFEPPRDCRLGRIAQARMTGRGCHLFQMRGWHIWHHPLRSDSRSSHDSHGPFRGCPPPPPSPRRP
eukprot:1177201-Pyramimonas_sp.AAC.1